MLLTNKFRKLSQAAHQLIAQLRDYGLIDNVRFDTIERAIKNDSEVIEDDPNHQMFVELRDLLGIDGLEPDLEQLHTAVNSYIAYKNAVLNGEEHDNGSGTNDSASTAHLKQLDAVSLRLAQKNNFKEIIANANALINELLAHGNINAEQEFAIRSQLAAVNIDYDRAVRFDEFLSIADLPAVGANASIDLLRAAIAADALFVTNAQREAAVAATNNLVAEVGRVQHLNAPALLFAQTGNFNVIIANADALIIQLLAHGYINAEQERAIRNQIAAVDINADRDERFDNLLSIADLPAVGANASIDLLRAAIAADALYVTNVQRGAAVDATDALVAEVGRVQDLNAAALLLAQNANKSKIASKARLLHTVDASILQSVHKDVNDAANAENYNDLRDALNRNLAIGNEHTLIHLLREAIRLHDAGFDILSRPAIEAAAAIFSGAVESHVTLCNIHPNAHNVVNARGQPMLTQYKQPVEAATTIDQVHEVQKAADLAKHVMSLRNRG